MSTTPHLGLPLLAAAQSQKHVTHNEAIAALDALVHLAVKERGRTNPPGSPSEGDRYLVGDASIGDFAGHAGEIALFDLGVWRFQAPRPGWHAYVEAEDIDIVFDGSAWRALGSDIAQFEQLGIGTQADEQNPLAVKLNSTLFTAAGTEESGTGDLRFVLNKQSAGNVLSQLYQSGYSGRAETGLVGNDDFGIRVSSDGNQWREAIRVDSATGMVSFPSGVANVANTNLLINASFMVNQRSHPGGALTATGYGYDRWKAGTGCSITRLSDGTISLTGVLDQLVDVGQAPTLIGASSFAGRTLTFSLENLSGVMSVTIGSTTVALTAGGGRRSATVTLDASATSHVLVRLQSTGACTFVRPKLELGSVATQWQGDWLEAEEMRCRRYYQRISSSVASGMIALFGQRKGANMIEFPFQLPVPLRAAPTFSTSGFLWVAASPTGNQGAFYDPATATWLVSSGGITVSAVAPSGTAALTLRFQTATSISGAAGTIGQLYLGNTSYIGLSAEL